MADRVLAAIVAARGRFKDYLCGGFSAEKAEVIFSLAFDLVQSLFPEHSMELLDSYEVTGSWAGDIEEAYSARASGLTTASVQRLPRAHRGDQLPPELAAASVLA